MIIAVYSYDRQVAVVAALVLVVYMTDRTNKVLIIVLWNL